jgi:hypothetical protein
MIMVDLYIVQLLWPLKTSIFKGGYSHSISGPDKCYPGGQYALLTVAFQFLRYRDVDHFEGPKLEISGMTTQIELWRT